MSIQAMNSVLKSVSVASLLALMLAGPAAAGTFEDGVSALNRADYAGALGAFTPAADQGDAKSQFALAEMYRQGQGVHPDFAKALAWYRRAADGGLPGAEYDLGMLYQAGQGVARDNRAAASWYAKAAAQGYASAELRLGVLYAEGRGEPRNDALAAFWLQKAADHGDADASQRLTAMIGDVGAPAEQFRAMMDRVFGPGRWRETSGYRSLAKENELRKEGAGTVPLGQRSHHSLGGPGAPGAYDAVVAGMSPQLAAAKLKRSREPLVRVVAEAAHGTQGPHLHIEPQRAQSVGPGSASADARIGRIALNARDRSSDAAATSSAGQN